MRAVGGRRRRAAARRAALLVGLWAARAALTPPAACSERLAAALLRAGRTVVLRAVDGWVRAVVGEDAGGCGCEARWWTEETHWLLGACATLRRVDAGFGGALLDALLRSLLDALLDARLAEEACVPPTLAAVAALRAAGSVSARDVRRGVDALLRRAEGGPAERAALRLVEAMVRAAQLEDAEMVLAGAIERAQAVGEARVVAALAGVRI